jgi:hypothetical protein
MNKTDRKLFRAAVAIQDQACRTGPVPDGVHLPEYHWDEIQRLKRQVTRASRNGWRMAEMSLLKDLTSQCRHFHNDLDVAYQKLLRRIMPRLPPSVSAIFRDLQALEDEFGEVEIDLKANEIAVTTDSITLDDVYLGPFEIRLCWNGIGDVHQPYRVIALDPQPSARREDVTHPHVQDEHVYEGEGGPAIAAALAERRIHAFFLLVDTLLHTYGRGSAFVELDHWTGLPCDGCGTHLSDDEQCECHDCNDVLCGDCSTSCQGCDDWFCNSCLSECAVCCEGYCLSCLETCGACRQRCCQNCLQENGLCRHCHDKQTEENDHESTNECECEADVAA